MEQSYKEKYEDILARLERAKNDNEVCDERFCCVIDDIIPELVESEDEKVRKALIEYFNEQCDMSDWNGVYGYQVVSWLERQGEHANFRNKIQVGDKVTRNEDGQLKRVAKPRERQCEQKPIEQQMYWTEEEIEPIISDYLCGREHYGGMIGRLCHLKPKQKQTEWGEDDKAFLDDILCKLEHDLILNKNEKDWLKSLKGRAKPQWTPSDEQMEALDIEKACDAFCKVRCQGSPPRSTCTSLGTCKEYDDFRKAVRRKVYE